MILTLFSLSLIGGFFSGFLGIGGAVVLIPLMRAIPPLFNVGYLTMNEVAGITMVQVLAASVTGFLAHNRRGFVHKKLILSMGVPMGIFSLSGAVFSRSMDSGSVLLIFGCLVALAFVMLLKKASDESENASLEFDFHTVRSMVVGGGVGLVSGIVGAGGGFILIPLMIRILNVPMRVTVGSSLGMVFIGAVMGSVGKIVTLQVEWIYLLPVIVGSIPAALFGARVSKMASPGFIRYTLIAVVLMTFLETWGDIVWGISVSP